MDSDYADVLEPLANTPTQAESLLHSLEQVARGISLFMNSDKTEFICFKQNRAISTLNGKLLKLVDQFTYHGSNISSTERDVNICIRNIWTAIDRLLIIWKSDQFDMTKWEFFQVVAVSV